MINLLLIVGLSDDKLISKTEVLLKSSLVNNIYLFRSNGNVYPQSNKVKTMPLIGNGFYNKGLLLRFIFDIYNLIGFSFLLFFKKIDVLIGFYLYPHGYYASLLGKIFKKPVILILPGTDLKVLIETKKQYKLFKQANYLGLRGNDSINKLVDLGFDRNGLFILHNVFNIWQFEIGDENEKKYDIIFTGFLRKLKRIDIILEVVKEIKNEIPNVKCLIMGEGSEINYLIQLREDLKLRENVEIRAYSKPIKNVLKISKLYILTSESEGLPMSIIEAMSCGLPVVVSDINDIPDVVKHGKNGFLVPPHDVQGFTKYCLKLLNNEILRISMGKQARATIERFYKTDFSFEAVSKVWDNILKKSIKNY